MQVYFSRHADQELFIDVFTSHIEAHWETLFARDPEKLYLLWQQSIALPMYERIAKVQEKDPKLFFDKVGSIILAHAVLGEVLLRWPECYLLDVKFIDEHAYAIDKQIRYHEYTGDKACFFALCHVGTGVLCEKADKDRLEGKNQSYVFSKIKVGQPIIIVDLLVEILKNIRTKTHGEPVAKKRFETAAKELFRAAEAIIALQDLVIKKS